MALCFSCLWIMVFRPFPLKRYGPSPQDLIAELWSYGTVKVTEFDFG